MPKEESKGAKFVFTMGVEGSESGLLTYEHTGMSLEIVALWEATLLDAWSGLAKAQARGENPVETLD